MKRDASTCALPWVLRMVFMLAGRVPALEETVAHPNGWRFEVIDGDPRMVRRLRLHPPI
jgi:CBS domain containing-hemolysin-like protein